MQRVRFRVLLYTRVVCLVGPSGEMLNYGFTVYTLILVSLDRTHRKAFLYNEALVVFVRYELKIIIIYHIITCQTLQYQCLN